MPFRSGGGGVKRVTSNSTKENYRWGAMVSGKRDGFLDAASLNFGMLISTSTEAGHKAVNLVAMPKKKV